MPRQIRQIRCKFKVVHVEDNGVHTPKAVVFEARYDPSLPEDARFQKNTPTGVLRASFDGPAAEAIQLGQDYYVDITPILPEPSDVPQETSDSEAEHPPSDVHRRPPFRKPRIATTAPPTPPFTPPEPPAA